MGTEIQALCHGKGGGISVTGPQSVVIPKSFFKDALEDSLVAKATKI